MDDVNNQWRKIFITTGLLFLITFLGELLIWNIRLELGEAEILLWMFVIIPSIIIAIIGAIAFLVKDAPAYRSFFKVIFKIWLTIHIIWSIASIWFYNALTSVRWL